MLNSLDGRTDRLTSTSIKRSFVLCSLAPPPHLKPLLKPLLALLSPSISSLMASSSSSSPPLELLFLFIFFFFFFYRCSSHIIIPLTHSLSTSTSQFNQTHHLLKSSATASINRFHHHKHKHHQISLPLSPGSDYTLSLSLGSKQQTISLYLDTGSDLVWFPCAPFDCILCQGKYDEKTTTPPPNPSSFSHIPCNSPVCSAAHSSLPSSDLCAISHCPLETIEISDCSSFSCPPFYYAYGDGSLIGRLYQEKLSIPPSLQLPNFTFGCAHTALAEPIGVAGFGRGILSLPAQLTKLSPHLGNTFSYCLISHSFDVSRILRPSPLILGRRLDKQKQNEFVQQDDEFVYTPMLHNPKHPYLYCIGLEAITIGNKTIHTSNRFKKVSKQGNGGMVVDSGTTFTMLPSKLYQAIVTEFVNRVEAVYQRATQVEDQTGLSPCYYLDDDHTNSSVVSKKVPKMVLHFVGNSSIVLPRRNYFFGFPHQQQDGKRKRKVGCLMLINACDENEDESSGPAATLGNYQQQGFEVVYDLKKGRVGFARKQCASLWDSLNPQAKG